MMWLAQHMALWLGLSFALGLATSVLLTVRRVTVERWEEVPPEPVAVADETGAQEQTEEEGPAQKAVGDSEPQSPFPVLEGAEDPAPWEQEELWSRPAKLARSGRASHEPGDEWEEAASNWRTWAEEAAAKKAEHSHKDAATASGEPSAAADAPPTDPYGPGVDRRLPPVDPYGPDQAAQEVTAGAGAVSARHRSPADDELFARDREAAGPQDDELFARDREVSARQGSGAESPFPAPVPAGEPSPFPSPDAVSDAWRDPAATDGTSPFPAVHEHSDETPFPTAPEPDEAVAVPAAAEENDSVFATVAGEGLAAPAAEPLHADSEPDVDSAVDLESSFPDSGAAGSAEDPVTRPPESEPTSGHGGGFARPFRRKRRSELLRDRQQGGEASRSADSPAAPSVAAAASAGLVPTAEPRADEPREDTSAVSEPSSAFDAPVAEQPAVEEMVEEPAADEPAVDEAVVEKPEVGEPVVEDSTAAPWADQPAQHRPDDELQADAADIVTELIGGSELDEVAADTADEDAEVTAEPTDEVLVPDAQAAEDAVVEPGEMPTPDEAEASLGWAEVPVEESADEVLVPDAQAAEDAVVEDTAPDSADNGWDGDWETGDESPFPSLSQPEGSEAVTPWVRHETAEEALGEAAAAEPEPEPIFDAEPEPLARAEDEDLGEPAPEQVEEAEPGTVDEAELETDGDPDEDHADDYDFSGGIPRPYGPGSAFAPADGSMPVGYGIKGQRSTMLFYPRGARFYSRVVADVYFDTEEAAQQAGFVRFDRRSSTAHVSLRPENLR